MESIPALNWWQPEAMAVPDGPSAVDAPRAVARGPWPFRALAAFTVVLIAAPQEFFSALKPFHLALATAVVAIACQAVQSMNDVSVKRPVPVAIPLVLALSAWAVAMVPLSYWPRGSLAMLFGLYFKSVAIFVLLATVISSRRRLVAIAWTLGLCMVPIAVVALLHFRDGVFLASAPGRIVGYGTSGLAGNPNDLALLLNLVIPILVALSVGQRGARRWLALGIAAVCVAAVIATFSRSGFLTLATTAVLCLWRMVRENRLGAAALIVAAILGAVLLAPSGYAARLSTVTDIQTDTTQSAQNRWRDTVVAAEFVVRHPVIGAGAGMDYLALNDLRGAAWLSVHNAYLNYAVDLGLPGLVLFLWLLSTSFAGVWRVERRGGPAGDALAPMAAAVRISLSAFAVAACFYPIAYHAYFYYIAGLAVAIPRIAGSNAAPAAGAEVTA